MEAEKRRSWVTLCSALSILVGGFVAVYTKPPVSYLGFALVILVFVGVVVLWLAGRYP